jgi:hypothetical protein
MNIEIDPNPLLEAKNSCGSGFDVPTCGNVKKNYSDFPVPSQDVTHQTLPLWPGKSLPFFTVWCQIRTRDLDPQIY